MIPDYIDSIARDPKYAILWYEITGEDVILFVSEINDAQADIQKSIDGVSISIVKAA